MHTDPSIRRITVEIPAECPIRADDLEWAFAGLEPCDPQTGTARSSRITSTDDSRMADRFMRRARAFRSITAVVLPSAPRRRIGTDGLAKKPAAERHREEALAAGAVVHALRHAGVRAKPIGIRVRREPFHHRGVRAERFAEGSRFSKHALWHVELRFAEAIAGPLVIGDGRFCGLGLMVPVTEHADVVAFKLETPNRIAADDCVLLVRALRRALMAIARNDVGSVDRLFSGHEPDGGADRSGHHAHVLGIIYLTQRNRVGNMGAWRQLSASSLSGSMYCWTRRLRVFRFLVSWQMPCLSDAFRRSIQPAGGAQ